LTETATRCGRTADACHNGAGRRKQGEGLARAGSLVRLRSTALLGNGAAPRIRGGDRPRIRSPGTRAGKMGIDKRRRQASRRGGDSSAPPVHWLLASLAST
jgi:hypothetical protein